MKRTGFLYDDRYLLHDTGPYHPEMPERLQAIYKGIDSAGLLPHLTRIRARPADMKWIEAVHDPAYIRRFEEVCLSGHRSFESPDNQMCTETFEIAQLAVGGILDTVDQLMEGKIDNAFCAVRPPGHHAEKNAPMGFCYFNNVAIAARYLQARWSVNRVGIIDFDVHHGNGTQHVFENSPTVFYYSMHEHPSFAFPGTGRAFEKGTQEGTGFTRNWPILPGQGDREYQDVVKTDMIPAMEAFAPEFLLVSTGFDAHVEDDMSGISLTTAGYSWIMTQLVALAQRITGGKLISVLEGGYCLARLPELAGDHVRILLDGKMDV
ncbi:MAG: histone deacetylase [Desulfobacterales bacterium]|nr:histone deacetylase [Desulfobacterales bacterium]